MEIWVATGNRGKLSEIKVLLEPLRAQSGSLDVYSITDLKVFSPPPENGSTFLDNARIKTKALKSIKLGVWVIGDDSGLEVKGLANLPGVHSARYAGPHASDSENRAKLLKMMLIRQVQDRSATFKCCLVAYSPTGEEFIFNSEFPGTLSLKERGNLGFGYDSIFIPTGLDKTLAELGPAYKNQNSHRAIVLKQFIERVNSQQKNTNF
jgi:XTP/dITP diphosphohydrolase